MASYRTLSLEISEHGLRAARASLPNLMFDGPMFRIATANVNGIRAAYRRGIDTWLAAREVDVLCLQEVRAPDEILRELLGDEWHIAHAVSAAKGRAGVAIASRTPLQEVRYGVGDSQFDDTGRWVEADLMVGKTPVTVVSAYVHSGEVDTQKQIDKYAFLEAMESRIAAMRSEHELAVVVGDFNIAHQNVDIKNWRGNTKKAGFLPEERVYLDRFFAADGWVDLGRAHGGEGPGPYTWWTWRGQAFANDTGWRIDYQMATPALAAKASSVVIDRAASYEERWSDHAPVVVDYEL